MTAWALLPRSPLLVLDGKAEPKGAVYRPRQLRREHTDEAAESSFVDCSDLVKHDFRCLGQATLADWNENLVRVDPIESTGRQRCDDDSCGELIAKIIREDQARSCLRDL